MVFSSLVDRFSLRSRLHVSSGVLIPFLSTFFIPYVSLGQIPAFPGAEGFGSTTTGGRGGVVLFVTNLNDNGPGSLRSALEASGPRIVIFRTGGTIFLNSVIIVGEPFLTLAGQSAPGDGITIANEPIRIKTHDVIVRGIRSRAGDLTGTTHPLEIEAIDMIGASDPVYNVILDHCSFSWGLDKNASTWGDVINYGTAIHDITIQWCISSEALFSTLHPKGPDHAMGMFFSGTRKASAHHNLLVHNNARQPQFSKKTEGEGINNTVYNYTTFGIEASAGAQVNLIGNYFKTGGDWTGVYRGINVDGEEITYGDVAVYVDGNIGPGRPSDLGDDWDAVTGDEAFRSFTPPTALSGVISQPAEEAYELVLANAGVYPRDVVDLRAVYDAVHNTGTKIESQSDVGGWPTLAPGTAQVDSDNDGMPNAWETANGLNPNSAGDGNGDLDGDGYLNIEEYINSLIVPHGTIPYANIDQVLCGVATAALEGNEPLLGTGSWRLVGGTGTITSPSSALTPVTGLATGDNMFEWRILHNGITKRDTVKITIETPPTVADAGTDRILCNVTQTSLGANTPSVGTGTWRVLLGPALLTNAANPNTAVSGLQIGDNEFEWSIASTASCPVSRDTVRFTVDALPSVADAGPDEETCNPTQILAGVRPVVGSGLWTVLVGPAVLDDPTDHNATVSGLQVGLNQLEWSVSNGVCPPSRDTVNITLTIAPVSDFSFSFTGLSVQFTSLAQNAETYSWNFGDGTSSTQQNPTHLYSVIRSYRVTHTVTNDCGTSSKRIRVSLSGTAGILNIPKTMIDFGEVHLGSSSTSSVTVANVGTDTLDIEQLHSDFLGRVFSYDVPEFSLAPGADASFSVTFRPDSETENSLPLYVSANDTTGTVLLLGTGTSPPAMGYDNDSRGAVEFGEVALGGRAAREVTLTNSSTSPLIVEGVSILRGKEFSIDAGSVVISRRLADTRGKLVDGELVNHAQPLLPAVLRFGDSLKVSVFCTPTTEDSSEGLLRLVTSVETHDISLRVVGVLPATAEARGGKDTVTASGADGAPADASPDTFELLQNYPNPFNSTTRIRFSLGREAHVIIRVYDALGQEIRTLVDEVKGAGIWQTTWEGTDHAGVQVSSGIYIYKIETEGVVRARRMILLR